jgi:hypothetical protein
VRASEFGNEKPASACDPSATRSRDSLPGDIRCLRNALILEHRPVAPIVTRFCDRRRFSTQLQALTRPQQPFSCSTTIFVPLIIGAPARICGEP